MYIMISKITFLLNSYNNKLILTEPFLMQRVIWQEQQLLLKMLLRRKQKLRKLLKLKVSLIDFTVSLNQPSKESVNLMNSFLNYKQ